MKKLLTLIAIILLVSALALTFASCSPAGTYKFESIKYDVGSMHFEYKVGDKIMGVSFDGNVVTLTLNRDGTYSLVSTVPGYEVEETGGWKKDGDKILFDDSGYTATVKGKTMTIEKSGVVIVLKR